MASSKKSPVTEVLRPNKLDLFVEAYFRHNLNGTEAALEVFDVKGDEKHRRATAGTMALEYLRKPEAQEQIAKRMARLDVSLEFILEQLRTMIVSTDSADVKLRALDRLAFFLGVELKERNASSGANRGPQVQVLLNLPDTRKLERIVEVNQKQLPKESST